MHKTPPTTELNLLIKLLSNYALSIFLWIHYPPHLPLDGSGHKETVLELDTKSRETYRLLITARKFQTFPSLGSFCSCFRSRGTWILSSWMKNLLSPSLCNFYYPMEANEQLVSLQFLSFFITNEVFNNFYIRLTSTATTAHWNFHNNFHRKLLLWNIFFSTESFNFLFEDFSHEPRLTPTIRDRMN